MQIIQRVRENFNFLSSRIYAHDNNTRVLVPFYTCERACRILAFVYMYVPIIYTCVCMYVWGNENTHDYVRGRNIPSEPEIPMNSARAR